MGSSQGTQGGGGPTPSVSDSDLQFLCKNTGMTEEQARTSFTKFMENNPEGRMTRESFREMMKLCYPTVESLNLEKHIFRKAFKKY